jgi:hypothetical protein
MRVIGRLVLGALLALAAAGPAVAATLYESNMPGQAFSPLWSAPTQIGAGITTIEGTGNQNQYDNLVFTALPSGTQSIGVTFNAPRGIDWSYAAGGTMLVSTEPFRWSWDGMVQSSFGAFYWRQSETLMLNLGPSFSGALYLALNFTYGSNLSYTISAPSNFALLPPPTGPGNQPQDLPGVPLPAGGVPLAAVLAGLAALPAFGRRRGRRT